jgi:putative transposase
MNRPSNLRQKLLRELNDLHEQDLLEVDAFFEQWRKRRDWHHAPMHRDSPFPHIVTAATWNHEHLFLRPEDKDFLLDNLLRLAKESGWELQAWVVFSNHYHLVGQPAQGACPVRDLLTELHRATAVELNRRDNERGRQVWCNYWETALDIETSYYARLNYVHQNPVRHGLVPVANQYRWCSAAVFEREASPAQVRKVYSFGIDYVNVPDEFEAR